MSTPSELLNHSHSAMDPIDTLMNEHQRILQVLSCLETMVSRSEAGGLIDETDARSTVRFLREFADGIHHGKEESLYIPALEQKGLGEQNRLTQDTLLEHVEGRELIGEMEESLPQAIEGAEEALKNFRRAAIQFVFVCRRTIRNEDNFLLPIGDLALDADEQSAMREQFEAFDEPKAKSRAELLATADRLAERFDVSRELQQFGSA